MFILPPYGCSHPSHFCLGGMSQTDSNLQTVFENCWYVPMAVEYRNNLQRLRFRPVDDQIRIDGKELHYLICQGPAPMSAVRRSCQLSDLVQIAPSHVDLS